MTRAAKHVLGWVCHLMVPHLGQTQYPLGSWRWRVYLWLLSWAGYYAFAPVAHKGRAMAETSHEPIVALGYEQGDDGTYTVTAIVRGLQSEAHAQAALNHMQMLLCAAEVETPQ